MARAAAQTMTNGAPGPFKGLGRRAGVSQVGDVHYLYALVALELLATYVLRRTFRRAHGG